MRGQLTCLDADFLGIQESADDFFEDNRAFREPTRPGDSPGKQVVFLVKPAGKGGVRIAPRAEIMQFAANLLAPSAGRVGSEREVLVRFSGLVGFPRTRGGCRMSLRHDDCSLKRWLS